ncbi:MAG: hypothetical protein KJ077_13090 [Anaerolineae bacterium]|nr:hypothetical protein [Anaerolineae bacterium]
MAKNRTLIRFLGWGAVGAAAYMWVIRPWHLRWGATDEEVERTMPGDDVVLQPTFNATRGVTITANPEDIWPWLLQLGSKRAGFYSYDWVDNAGIPSSECILPEFQQISLADFIPMTPDGKQGMWVKDFKANEYILWWDKKGNATWLWQLSPLDNTNTRLITRLRVKYDWTPPWVFYYLVQDAGDIVMMRKCLLGLKRRVEAHRNKVKPLQTLE